jgi:PAS domain S-box-containing protein
MKEALAIQRYGAALAVGSAALLLTWLTGEALWLLAAVALIHQLAGRIPGHISIGICAAALAVFLLVPGWHFLEEGQAYVRLATFLAATLLVSLFFQDRQSVDRRRIAEHETRLIVESMPGLGWSTDPKGEFRYLNPAVFDYTGRRCEPGQPLSFGGQEVLHPDEADRVIKDWIRCLQTGEPYQSEHRLRRHDGVYRWFRAAARPSRDSNGRITGWYGVTLDIDDQKKAEEGYRTEHEARLIVESLPGLGWSASPNGRFKYLNPGVFDYLGLGREEVVRIDRFAWMHPDDVERTTESWQRCLKSGDPYEAEARLRRRDGVYRWCRIVAQPSRGSDGRITDWYGVTIDIDDQKQAEEALRKSEQQLRLLIDTIPALVWCARPSGDPFYLNKRLLDYAGLSPEEASQSRWKMIHPDDLPVLLRTWAQSVKTGQTFLITYRLRRADGVYRWHEGRAEPYYDQTGRLVQWYGVNVDIDERLTAEQALRSTQAQFQRAAQIASLAELSASIAHEVNQPLAAVVTNSHACQRWLAAEPPNLQRARLTTERIIRDANAAADVVSRVRALFKQTGSTRGPVDLNQVVSEACRLMVDEVIARKIEVETSLAPDLPPALADRVQVQQVLVNLIRNGVEAMDSSPDRPRSLTICSRRDGADKVLVEVRDRGSGVEDTDKIFDPFFTTKAHGMGMGLAICRSIVEAHEGRLWAVKGDPTGTSFLFTLPAHPNDAA